MLREIRGTSSPIVGEVYAFLVEYARSKAIPLKALGMEPEDFVQDVFMVLWERTNQLTNLRENPKSYVFVCAKRRLVDLIRKGGRRPKLLQENTINDEHGLDKNYVGEFADVPAESELDPYIRRMLESLPDDNVKVSRKIPCGWRGFLGAWAEGDAEGVMEKFGISRATAFRLREELLSKINYGKC